MRLALFLLAILVAGCDSSGPPGGEVEARRKTAEAPTSAAMPAATPEPAAPAADVTMRYRCDQGHRVDIVGGDTARVTLADGRTVDIPRVAGSAPPRYAGEALSFEIGNDGATLGQDEVGGFPCRASD